MQSLLDIPTDNNSWSLGLHSKSPDLEPDLISVPVWSSTVDIIPAEEELHVLPKLSLTTESMARIPAPRYDSTLL
ncbi:uncharacterized [Tachysurus ichikawai]